MPDGVDVLQDLVDRARIRELLQLFHFCIDQRDYETLSGFYADEVEDASRLPGEPERVVRSRAETVASVRAAMANEQVVAQHLTGPAVVSIDGDAAEASCYMITTYILPNTWGGDRWEVAGRFTFGLVRAGDGWQIRSRRAEPSWVDGNAKIADLARDPRPEGEHPASAPPSALDRKVGRVGRAAT